MIHFLDLPQLNQHPSFEILRNCLTELSTGPISDFEEPEHLDKNIRQWLSRLSINELDWLSNEDDRESIRNMAAQRLSQECGVSASGSRVRTVNVPPVGDILLNEPGVTEDSLGKLTWGASLVMAKRIAKNVDCFNGKTVLELGAGTGLCGILAAWAGASVELTDLPEIVDNLEYNLKLNKMNGRVFVFDWKEPPSSSDYSRPDLLLVSDPLYSSMHPHWLFNALSNVLAPQIWLQLPLRPKFINEREKLYELMSTIYVRVEYEEEEGRDLFGVQQYAFTKWILK